MSATALTLVGATGYTGRLIARRLWERGVTFTATGRDVSSVETVLDILGARSIPIHRLDLSHPEDLDRLVRPGHLILSCVGPYSLYGRGLTEAVARKGATYVDLTGEEGFVARSQHELDGLARASGALLLHACAFESLPADMLAAMLCRSGTAYSELASYYRVPGHAMSPGTQLTMRLAAHWPTTRFVDGEFVEAAPASLTRDIQMPFLEDAAVAVFAPYPEIRLWPRVHDTRAVSSFLAMRRGEAALLAGLSRHRQREIEEILARHKRTPRRGPTLEERARQAFDVAVVATDTEGVSEAAHLRGVDPYGFTAAIAVWVCEKLLQEKPDIVGVRAPSEVFTPKDFLEMAQIWQPKLAMGRARLASHVG